MPRKNTTTKRGPGRPRKPPYDLQAEIEKANAGIRRTARRQLGLDNLDVEQFIEDTGRITRKNKFTEKEMYELRRTLHELYDCYVTEKDEREAQENRELNERLREEALTSDKPRASKSITEEEWHLLHGRRADGKEKPGPKPRKKKQFFEVAPGELGTATSKAEPIDIEAMEAELQAKMFEEHAEEKRTKPQPPKGKRFRSAIDEVRRRRPSQNFWR